MRENFNRNGEHINIGTIGVKKQSEVTFDDTLEAIKQIDREYNRKLLRKLILLYGKDNAISIYNKIKQEDEKELKELIEISRTSDVESLENSIKW